MSVLRASLIAAAVAHSAARFLIRGSTEKHAELSPATSSAVTVIPPVGDIATEAGNGDSGDSGDDGAAIEALLNNPFGVTLGGGTCSKCAMFVFVSDHLRSSSASRRVAKCAVFVFTLAILQEVGVRAG